MFHYTAEIPRGKVFFESDRLAYTIADLSHLHDAYFHSDKPRNANDILLDAHGWEMRFVNGNPSPDIDARGKYSEYHNYFIGNDPSKWAGNVGLYSELRYENVWEGIDLEFRGQENSLKYDVYVQPQKDAQQVRFQYEGLDDLYVDEKGNLVMVTSLGEIREMAPYAYQKMSGMVVDVPCRFVVEGNTVHFEFPEGYDEDYLLVIDPSLIFGSYTGSTADNFGYTATYDTSGNLYGGGIAFGVGYPILGAYQGTFGGGQAGNPFPSGFDISISKFNPNGTALVWSTYIGGNNNEQPQSLITNDAAELVIYGRTWSNNYPVSNTAYQNMLGGVSDIVITKLDGAGANLVGSTFMGGNGNDGLNIQTTFFQNSLYHNYGDDARGEVMIDGADNIYIASCTQSQNFPTQNPYQPAYGGGGQDAVAFKMNSDLSQLLWSTYLGGSGNDAAYSIKVDASLNAYIAGGTESNNFPTTNGTVSPGYNGAIDGFVTILDPSGGNQLASTYIGTSAYDQCYFLELDAARNVYLVGQTLGAFPVSAGVYSNNGGKQFITKLDPLLTTTQFSTVFGTGNATIDISPTAFLVDRCGFIYVSGWGGTVNFGGNTNNLPVTNDAYQSTTDGSDIYLLVLEPDALGLEYASFYGGPTSSEHVDGGTSRFDKELRIYQAVCAGCGGNSDFPTTQGAVSQTNNSANCNLGVFKFQFEPQDVIAAYIATAFDSCAPFPVQFTNNSQGGVGYIWDFGDNTPTDTATNPFHLYTNPGTYTVTLVAIDSNSCNFSDTAVQTITVYANPIAVAGGSDTVCAGGNVQLSSGGGDFYNWSPGVFLNDSTIANPQATPTQNVTFSVIVSDSNGCVDTAYVDVFVTNFTADAGPPAGFCEGTGGAQLQAGAINGGTAPYYYTWWCDSSQTFCGLDSMFDNDPIANPTQTTTYYLQVQDSRGCLSDIDSVVVEMLPVPIADAGPDQFICQPPAPGALLQGSFSGAPGPYTYYWMPGTGLNDSTLLNPYARPDTTTIYTLVGISSNGCSSDPTTLDTLSTVTVTVHPRPIAEAGPDIHSCLGDTVQIQGYGFGAGPNYRFEWSPFTGLSDSTISNPLAAPPITTEYILTTWSNGCPSIGDTMTLWVHTLPTPSAGNIAEICLGDSGQLDAFGAGDSSASYTYLWMPGAGLNDSTLENPLASPDTTTWYYLTVTSSWGCESPLDSVLVKLKPTPIAEAGPNLQLCEGDTTVLLGSYFYTTTDSADPSDIYFSWNPNVSISDSTVPQPSAWPGTSGWYFLDVRHNTCLTRDSAFITVNPGIDPWVGADTSNFCEGDSIRVYAGGGLGGVTYTWLPASGLSDPFGDTLLAAPGDTTLYQVAFEEGGCHDTLELQLNVIPRPDMAMLSSLTQGCPPLSVNFLDDSKDIQQWIWDFGDDSPVSNEANPTHTYTDPGTYNVQLIGVNTGGCADTLQGVTVEVGDTTIADFLTEPELPAELYLPNARVQFRDRSFGSWKWHWDFGDGQTSEEKNPVHTYQQPGEYIVTLRVFSGDGCIGIVKKGPIVVYPPEIFIPNVFSPNGAINDEFRVEYQGNQPFLMQIFDRWGNQIFETRNKNKGWIGNTEDGELVPEGVYFYRVQIGDQEYVGNVTLVR